MKKIAAAVLAVMLVLSLAACASGEEPVELRILGKIFAGEVFHGEVHKGECVRLMTGAPVPEGANAVIRQEDTDYEPGKNGDYIAPDSKVKIFRGAAPYQNNE